MALDYKALARAQYDPLTQNGMYRQEKSRLRKAMAADTLASVAAPGSIAARNDPNNFGSIASRNYPGLFGLNSQAAHQDNMAYQANVTASTTPQPQQPALRRQPEDKTPFSLDDLNDDDFLNSLGLNFNSSLRRVSSGQ